MWDTYVNLTVAHPLPMAFVQFVLLGTLGEVASMMLRTGQRRYPFSARKTALKALTWGLLGLYIKLMFLTATAGVTAMAGHDLLPRELAAPASFGARLAAAFAAATLMNVMFGPSMMLLHRLADNGIDRLLGERPIGWAGLDKSMATLIWLWIPLQTFNFMQPQELRMGIAAFFSLLLGVIMGFFSRPRAASADT